MELIRGLRNLAPSRRGSIVTIGNFDGVHRAHQAIVSKVVQLARRGGQEAVVVTFEPLPHEYFAPHADVARLTSLREKYELIARLGIDRLVCLRFGPELAQMPAEAFVRRLLVEGLAAVHVLVGDDFHFGRARTGNLTTLAEAGRRDGFTVEPTPTIEHAGIRISSTQIRAHLGAGRIDEAADLLGRAYHLSGRVMYGDRVGRTLGFPTANLGLGRRRVAPRGVFAVWVHGVAARPWPGVTNVGVRPTVAGRRLTVETHLLDFSGELYGRRIAVEFARHIRGEQRFESLEALQRQIDRDATSAREQLLTPE